MLTPTKLRSDLYRVLDEIIATGQPVEVTRGGHVLRIEVVRVEPPVDRRGIVARIPRHPEWEAYDIDLEAEPTRWEWSPDTAPDTPERGTQ